ncbi:hypothetical protein [Roseomonas sp. 18066]|uniref:hypothetical protein n=1 Tax=Roseomonas sp. 18066 TaxID=2681412 RepID=UPI00135C53F4|nr:hypothetical protein [Roseomonas sp. 18066]
MAQARRITGWALLAGLALAPAAWAQGTTPGAAPACEGGSQATPATPRQAGADATAPGNAGSTGWSGGTGGSQIGTSTQGGSPQSATWQPPTARGLDPLKPRPRRAC